MKPGDRVLYYHTGKEKAVVGEMVVAGEPGPDPKSDDEAAVVVPMRPVRKFAVPVPLAAIKAELAGQLGPGAIIPTFRRSRDGRPVAQVEKLAKKSRTK